MGRLLSGIKKGRRYRHIRSWRLNYIWIRYKNERKKRQEKNMMMTIERLQYNCVFIIIIIVVVIYLSIVDVVTFDHDFQKPMFDLPYLQ